jgi:hypothetical protein
MLSGGVIVGSSAPSDRAAISKIVPADIHCFRVIIFTPPGCPLLRRLPLYPKQLGTQAKWLGFAQQARVLEFR